MEDLLGVGWGRRLGVGDGSRGTLPAPDPGPHRHRSLARCAGAGRTRWIVTTDFQFRGLWRLLGPLFRGEIRKRTVEDLGRFKQKLESGAL